MSGVCRFDDWGVLHRPRLAGIGVRCSGPRSVRRGGQDRCAQSQVPAFGGPHICFAQERGGHGRIHPGPDGRLHACFQRGGFACGDYAREFLVRDRQWLPRPLTVGRDHLQGPASGPGFRGSHHYVHALIIAWGTDMLRAGSALRNEFEFEAVRNAHTFSVRRRHVQQFRDLSNRAHVPGGDGHARQLFTESDRQFGSMDSLVTAVPNIDFRSVNHDAFVVVDR